MSVDHMIGVAKNTRLIKLVTTWGISRNLVEIMPNSIVTQPALIASKTKPGTASSTVQDRPGCGVPPGVMTYPGVLRLLQKTRSIIAYTSMLCANISVCRHTVRNTYIDKGAGKCLMRPSLSMNVEVPSFTQPRMKFQTMKPA